MFIFYWLDKWIKGESIEKMAERLRKERLKKELHYTQNSHILSSQSTERESDDDNSTTN